MKFYWDHAKTHNFWREILAGTSRNSSLELFLGIDVMKISQIYRTPMPKCNFNNFIETIRRHGWSPVNLLHIFRAPFLRITMEGYSWMSLWPFLKVFNLQFCLIPHIRFLLLLVFGDQNKVSMFAIKSLPNANIDKYWLEIHSILEMNMLKR